MFGFQPLEVAKQKIDEYGRSDGLYAKIKKSFGTLEKCSETEVTGMVQQCRALSSRYEYFVGFDSTQLSLLRCVRSLYSCFSDSANHLEQKFNNLVCNNLKCEKGVLKVCMTFDLQLPTLVFFLMSLVDDVIMSSSLLVTIFCTCIVLYREVYTKKLTRTSM